MTTITTIGVKVDKLILNKIQGSTLLFSSRHARQYSMCQGNRLYAALLRMLRLIAYYLEARHQWC